MKQRIKKLMPKSLKVLLEKVYYLPVNLFERLTKRDGMIPPRSMIFVGGGDFRLLDFFDEWLLGKSNDSLSPLH